MCKFGKLPSVLTIAIIFTATTAAKIEHWRKDTLIVFRDPEIDMKTKSTSENILKVFSNVGPQNKLNVTCDGTTKELMDQDFFEFAVIKQGIKWTPYGRIEDKALRCDIQLIQLSTGNIVKMAKNVLVDLDLYVYEYGFGNYGGFLGLWTYLGKW